MDEREQLEKLDLIRARFHVSYARAHEVLVECQWDVIKATLHLEAELRPKGTGARIVEELKVTGANLVETVKNLLHQGNVSRIVVLDDHGRELLNLPVNGVLALTVLLPLLTAVGAVVAVAMQYTVRVERQG